MLGVIIASVLSVAPLVSQTPTVQAGQAFVVRSVHDGIDTIGYRIRIDGFQVGADIPVSTLVESMFTSPVLVMNTRGSHVVKVCAFNTEGEVASPALDFTIIGALPSAPTLPVIVPATSLAEGPVEWRAYAVLTVPTVAATIIQKENK